MFKETYLTETFKNYIAQDVPGATVDKNPSANAGDTRAIAGVPEQQTLWATAAESLCCSY